MKKYYRLVVSYILWALLIVIVFVPAIYLWRYRPGTNFWDNAMGNWLATIAALVGGIPVALAINRAMLKQENRDELQVNRLREKEILTLIKEELEFSLNSLFLTDRKGNVGSVAIQQYKSNLWDALSAGGELKYIDDPTLLNRIASAYYALKASREIEAQAYLALRTSAISFTLDGQSMNAAQMLLNDARMLDMIFEDNLTTAIVEINERLKAL